MNKNYLIILIGWILTSLSFGQVPEPKDFCSHALSFHTDKRKSQINYNNYDAYDVLFYHLNLNAESNSTYLSGHIDIKAQSIDNTVDTLVLELANEFNVDSVLFEDKDLDYLHVNEKLQIFFENEIQAQEIFTISIYYSGTAQSSNGRGYNIRQNYHGTSITWTLSEPFYSKDWWPCKQDLTDKADSVWVFVTTSKENKVGSNGLLTHTEELENNKVRYEWKSKYPIAYYLISIAVAEYMEYSFVIENEEGKQVFVQNYLYPDSVMFKNQKSLIDCTHLQMNLLQEKYGTYPFIDEKYGHSITPIGGGMEHQTMTTQNSFAFHLTVHEMGHSWFGNQVTCAKWNDIWINEGFATYSQYLGLQYLANEPTADAFMAAMQSVVMREPDGSVYVPEEFVDDRSRIFSGRLSYYKGAVIIQMIRYLIGNDDLFFSILREFQSRYKDATATGEDFKMVLEELNGQDFDSFFDLWYYGEGYPIYDFQWQQDVNDKLVLKSSQHSSTEKTAFFQMKYDLLLFFEDGSQEILSVDQQTPNQEFEMYLIKRVKNILPNPRSQNLMYVNSVRRGILQASEIKIEPNPVGEKCIIRFDNFQPTRTVQVYNAEQKLVFEDKAEQHTKILDLSEWSSGVYFVLVVDEKSSNLLKLIKY